ncbi:hypothetical protein J2X90_000705 [Variovorax paradoxus]|uniref:recombination protein NinG n=1 Tax=Variovorax paradoxus TaxID=34073 RepID=UPI002780CC20|nr:recombination protein NinG [Variovorax paradoxus]MDQ0022919.1 hypothetical protein [Variovorax paradoxus]
MLTTTLKPKPCAHCGTQFRPFSSTSRVCSPICAARFVKAKNRDEREQFKARKEKAKRTSKWEEECRAIVQKIARIRDRNDGCISCHLPATWGGQWHGSHFRSHGAASAVQFHLWNIHKSCSSCNRDKGGNIIAYRPRLVEKIGQEKVDWLMSQNQIVRHPVEYYKRFKAVMGKRLRRLEKRIKE